LSASAATTLLVERRRYPRFPTKMPVILIVGPEGKAVAHNASTVDFSNLGARIRTTVSLSVGEAVGIVAHERKRETVPCRVVWVGTSQRDGSRETGLEFLAGFNS
jgi:hypothetical protein